MSTPYNAFVAHKELAELAKVRYQNALLREEIKVLKERIAELEGPAEATEAEINKRVAAALVDRQGVPLSATDPMVQGEQIGGDHAGEGYVQRRKPLSEEELLVYRSLADREGLAEEK